MAGRSSARLRRIEAVIGVDPAQAALDEEVRTLDLLVPAHMTAMLANRKFKRMPLAKRTAGMGPGPSRERMQNAALDREFAAMHAQLVGWLAQLRGLVDDSEEAWAYRMKRYEQHAARLIGRVSW